MEYLLTLVKILTCQKQMRKLNLSELADDITCCYGNKMEIQTGHDKAISTRMAVQHWKRLYWKAGGSQSLDAYRIWPKSQLTYQPALVVALLPERGHDLHRPLLTNVSVPASDLQAVPPQRRQRATLSIFITSCSVLQYLVPTRVGTLLQT